ncbi:hypothetical protein D5H75_04265 [Bailinhaonella thermotolerans]|uniref:Uncharacterized protein n=1 Tax=Bailinhaonella thermotolerans TaxID=1070861 RepID=A0A3A4BDT4_9ACTN|nr:hypothetical protein D5H75_04265 [Bailinhaonella thermotolerans]
MAAAGLYAALLSALALANWLAWLGWDRERDIQPDGSATGPYEPWQVIGLGLVLAALSARAGRRGRPVIGTLALAGTTWLAWCVNAFLSDDSGLWGVGALMLLPVVFAGVALVTALAATTRPAPDPSP